MKCSASCRNEAGPGAVDMPSLGEAAPTLLKSRGFDIVFGIPGVHTTELYRGLPQSGLRHVTPRHEQGAGFMADGYARASGRPAVCFVISGPGVTNITTAMGQAYADSIPMLVISSVLSRRDLGRGEGRLHELKDQRALAEGVAASSVTVTKPSDFPGALDRAVAAFNSERPRPAHIELPLDVILAKAEELPVAPPKPPKPPKPDSADIAEAAAILRGARNPLLLLGGGATRAGPSARRLAEALGAPTVLTINAKGLLPSGHPLLVGSLLPQQTTLRALREADATLVVGSELGETDTLLFGGAPAIEGRLVRVDIEAGQLERNARPDIGIVADAGAACAALANALSGRGKYADGTARAAMLRKTALDTVPDAHKRHGRILDHVASVLPDVIIVGDSTQPVYGGNLTYDAPAPRSWFNSATGYGTLGYGLPAALGAQIARPDRPVVALVGDGGLLFTISELAVGVELNLPVPIVLWNNQGYGEIKAHMRDHKVLPTGVDILTPDFQAVARGFGCHAMAAPDIDALARALTDAVGADRPTLIEIDAAAAERW